MLTVIFLVISLALATTCVLLRKAYDVVPAVELKRQAASGNELARTLYRAVAYGPSLRVLLWIGILLGLGVGFVLLSAAAPVLMSVTVIAGLLWLNFSWLPKVRLAGPTMSLARLATPAVVWTLHYLDAPLRAVARFTGRYYRPRHSGLYELQDMLDLLDLQSQQPDSRITSEEIELIRNVLSFGDQQVNEIMRPRKQVKTVAIGDAIGPVLLDELHASGQTVFPVKKSTRSKEIIASLHLGDVGIHSTGTVQDYATQGASFINADDSLADALHAFFQTKQQLFVVLDDEQDYLGVITLEDILHRLVGRPAPDEQLGSHGEPAVVAARHHEDTDR